MSLTIYGSARSRTLRVLWLVTELGLEFEHIPLEWEDPTLKSPDFLALNPAGQIPTIVDDGFALAESLAIHMYLAKKHGSGKTPSLYPTTPEGEADLWRWSLFAEGQIEPWVQADYRLAKFVQLVREARATMLNEALATLDRVLADRSWLIADHFTVADLNVAAVLSPSRASSIDLPRYPQLQRWLNACYARPACVAARRRYAG